MEETFHRDLKKGKVIEREMLELIKTEHKDAHIVEGYCKEGDIFIPSTKEWIEIKSDEMSQKTGNIVVEIEFDGKPSALSTTKASYWIIHTGLKIIKITPDQLRIVIAKNDLKTVRFIATGDTKPKLAYLVKQPLIEEQAIEVIDLPAVRIMIDVDSLI